MTKAPKRRFLRLLACTGLGALVAGCVGDPVGRARMDPHSPVASDAARLVRSNRTLPTFAQIPPAPKDVRPAQGWKTAVAETESARDKLVAETAPQTWTLTGTERFASGAQSAVTEDEVAPRDTEGFAATARERATPPPPPR